MTCADIQANAAGLASLDADVPERQQAFAHARECSACRQALAEGEALMRVLDEALPVAAPQPAALARAKAEILAELAAEQDAGARGTARTRKPARTPSGARAASSGAIARAITWAAVVGIPIVSFLASAVAGGGGPFDASTGLRCLRLEIILSLPPLVVAGLLAWRGLLPDRRRALMAAAAVGAVAGQAVLGILCHAEPSHGHLLVFHTGGVLLALALGAVVGGLLPNRTRLPADPP